MQTWKHTVPCHQISLFAQVHDLILVCKETIVWREFLWHLSRKWIHVSLTRVRTQQTSPPKAPGILLFTSRTTCLFVRGGLGTRSLPLVIFPKHFSVNSERFWSKSMAQSYEFSEEEIRRKLEELGYSNIPDDKLKEFQRGLLYWKLQEACLTASLVINRSCIFVFCFTFRCMNVQSSFLS